MKNALARAAILTTMLWTLATQTEAQRLDPGTLQAQPLYGVPATEFRLAPQTIAAAMPPMAPTAPASPPPINTPAARIPSATNHAAPSAGRGLVSATGHVPATLPARAQLPAVRTPTMQINYQIAAVPPGDIARVELWYARGFDGNWQLYGYDRDMVSPVRFVTPGEGIYRLLVVAVDRWGRRSVDNTQAGTISRGPLAISRDVAAQLAIFVDYTPPQLHLLSPRGDVADYRSNDIRIRWAGFDTHLGERCVEFFYRQHAADQWIRIVNPLGASGDFLWALPGDLMGPVTIKGVITDQAGNIDAKLSGTVNVTRTLPQPTISPDYRPNDTSSTEVNSLPLAEQQVTSYPGPRQSATLDRTHLMDRKTIPAVAESPYAHPSALASAARPANQAGVRQAPADDSLANTLPYDSTAARAEEHYARANLHSQRREWQQAIRAYQMALQCDPTSVQARINLGNAYYSIAQYEQARACFTRALQLEPESDYALFGIASTQIALQQHTEALRSLDRLLIRNRNDWHAWLLRGDADEQLGHTNMALTSWHHAASGAMGNQPIIVQMAQERISRYEP